MVERSSRSQLQHRISDESIKFNFHVIELLTSTNRMDLAHRTLLRVAKFRFAQNQWHLGCSLIVGCFAQRPVSDERTFTVYKETPNSSKHNPFVGHCVGACSTHRNRIVDSWRDSTRSHSNTITNSARIDEFRVDSCIELLNSLASSNFLGATRSTRTPIQKDKAAHTHADGARWVAQSIRSGRVNLHTAWSCDGHQPTKDWQKRPRASQRVTGVCERARARVCVCVCVWMLCGVKSKQRREKSK